MIIIGRRCDEPMRISKEQCITRQFTPWRCTKDCRNCFCCIEKNPDGTEEHVNLLSKRERKDD